MRKRPYLEIVHNMSRVGSPDFQFFSVCSWGVSGRLSRNTRVPIWAISRSRSALHTDSLQFFLLRYWVILEEPFYPVAPGYNARAMQIGRSGVRPHDCQRRPSQYRLASASFIPQRYRSAQSHISGLADASRRVSIASSIRSSDLN